MRIHGKSVHHVLCIYSSKFVFREKRGEFSLAAMKTGGGMHLLHEARVLLCSKHDRAEYGCLRSARRLLHPQYFSFLSRTTIASTNEVRSYHRMYKAPEHAKSSSFEYCPAPSGGLFPIHAYIDIS